MRDLLIKNKVLFAIINNVHFYWKGGNLMDYENWVFHDVTPIYQQLCDKMSYSILNGNLRSGETIPSIREMAKLLHINPNTVAKSYKMIKQEQLIICSRSGKFIVTQDIKYIQYKKQETVNILCCSYMSKMLELGFNKSEAVELMKSFCEKIKFHD